MPRPESYREQNGCWNCQHVFALREYDSEDCYFCTLRADPRPPCGSVRMGEIFSRTEPAVYDAALVKWDKWSDEKVVESHGTCDEWKRTEAGS